MAQKTSKNQSCTFYIVRHGQTEWNIKGIMQGQLDSNLTPTGIKQAKTIANQFKNVKFDAIFSSDLFRAQHTAEIIALEHQLTVFTNQLLRERHFGSWQGKKVAELKQKSRHVFEKFNQLSHQEKMKFKYNPDSETDEEMIARFITFIRQVAISHSQKTVLIVSHGGIMRRFLIHLGFASYHELPSGTINNTGYIILKSDGVDFFIDKTVGIRKQSAQ